MTPEIRDHINTRIAEIDKIYSEAAEIIDKMSDGEKILLKDLCTRIGDKLEPTRGFTEVYPVIRLFLEGCPGVSLLRGRAGGLYKGKRQTK